jgi:hypothetical protein
MVCDPAMVSVPETGGVEHAVATHASVAHAATARPRTNDDGTRILPRGGY